jgi:hypothetical protein
MEGCEKTQLSKMLEIERENKIRRMRRRKKEMLGCRYRMHSCYKYFRGVAEYSGNVSADDKDEEMQGCINHVT